MDGDKVLSASESEAILEEARARFKLAIGGESANRNAGLDGLRFLNGEH